MRSAVVIFILVVPPAWMGGCRTGEEAAAEPAAEPSKEGKHVRIESSAFEHQTAMDRRFSCEGGDVSPPLSWSGAPEGTKSYALIVDDPDAPDPKAPKRVWVHWVLSDIPASVTSLDENASATGLPEGTSVGTNDWKKQTYGGPCPPIGRHRYFHKVYALDTVLGLEAPTKAELLEAMSGHVLAQGELVGTYQKGQ